MTGAETIPARRAALLLHGLPPAARQRIVARLSASELARLQPLLEELAELGVPQSISDQLQHVATQSQPAAARALTVLEQVEQLSAEDAARCLRQCSPATAARLLGSREWPWKAQALGLMPLAPIVVECMLRDSSTLAPAVLTALCERMCLHASAAIGNRPQLSEPSARRVDRAGRTARMKLRKLLAWIR